ncbi:ABC transporter substrate-binding protein [Micromonospora sp. CPCC 206061]|uniref:ABC transporter substrate-binding protein n=1 Tax=Micromonospora sp. CPCC 206061 TaxID=3122410 RepID=UPI002FF0F285
MSQIDRRQALKLLAAVGAAGLAAACATEEPADEPQTSDKPVKIGLIAPQTGTLKAIGDEITNGFQLYLELNQNLLGGHPVELVIADEGADARSAKAAVESLLKQGALALTGIANVGTMAGIRDTVESAKVPLIASNGIPRSLQSVLYIWCTSYVASEPSDALAAYLKREMSSLERVTVVAPDDDNGQDAVDAFRQEFGTGDARLTSTVLTEPTVSANRSFFDTALNQVRGINPDVVYAFYSGQAATEFVKQYRAKGIRARIYAPGFFTDGTMLADTGDEARGIFTAMNYSADINNAANRLFATSYRRAHDATPSAAAMASYDAAQVLDKAIRLSRDRLTSPQVNLMLGRVGQIDSPRGGWQFNQPRTPQQKWYLREVRRDGQVLSNVLINELATLG